MLIHETPGSCGKCNDCGGCCPEEVGKYEGGELILIVLCFTFTAASAIMMTVIAVKDSKTEKAAIVLSFELWLE